MAVTPGDVKKLRDATGAGMLDCKNALVKAEGDFAAAQKILKEQGLAAAGQRSGRAADNGLVFTAVEERRAVMVHLTCETDFVARNAVFRSAGEKIAAAVIASGGTEKTDELETLVKEAGAVLKENMHLGRIVCWDIAEDEAVVNYAHNGGSIGVLVKLGCESAEAAAGESVRGLAFDLALHAAAYNPVYLNRDAVDPDYLNEQREIFTAQANRIGGKPEKVIQGIAQGKLNKHLSQICFEDQGFVKDDKKPVKQVIAEFSKAAGSVVKLLDYAYIAAG